MRASLLVAGMSFHQEAWGFVRVWIEQLVNRVEFALDVGGEALGVKRSDHMLRFE